jgi:ASC-1-like (ASCH) protein
MMKIHSLKIKDEYLENLLSGIKKVEIRLNDRDYQVGDNLKFSHHIFGTKYKEVHFEITRILEIRKMPSSRIYPDKLKGLNDATV